VIRQPLHRRSFLTVLSGAAAAWPVAARAQQGATPVIGYLDPRSPQPNSSRIAAFRKGLSETGFIEGSNVAIEFRWGNDDVARVPELADLIHRQVNVITISGSDVAVRAAKAATSAIPIVFSTGTDPLQAGLVTSFNRPGGNITGLTNMSLELGPKRLGLLREFLPEAARIAALTSATNPSATEPAIADLQKAAAALNRQIEVFYASTNREIDAAFGGLAQRRADALLVMPFTFFSNRRVQIVTLAAHHSMPTFYFQRELPAGS
jgi:putative ABC transport system substrate-binding protein